jgi:hypothetical protein
MADRSQRGLRRAVESAMDATLARLPHIDGRPASAFFWSGLGASILISVAVAVLTLQVRWLLLLAWPCFTLALRPYLSRKWLAVASLGVLGVLLLGVGVLAPRSSWMFLSPAVNGSLMMLLPIHRGAEILDHVVVTIDDQERLDRLGQEPLVDGAEIAAAHREISYPEIDAINTAQVIWWPLLNHDSARLLIGIRCRGCTFGEDILMRVVGANVAYAIRVWKARGETLLSCRDPNFPNGPVQLDVDGPCSTAIPPPTLLRRWSGLIRSQFQRLTKHEN